MHHQKILYSDKPKLTRLMSDPFIPEIIENLQEEPKSKASVADKIRCSESTIESRLEALDKRGLIEEVSGSGDSEDRRYLADVNKITFIFGETR
ncbi:MAG: winged helix DNA-binding protein [Halobacteria archaeon]